MKRLSTKLAEKVYDVLIAFAEAQSDYYNRETFIFHYSVKENTSAEYQLECRDGRLRIFNCLDVNRMWVEGTNVDRVNSFLKKISSTAHREFQLGEFTVIQNEI